MSEIDSECALVEEEEELDDDADDDDAVADLEKYLSNEPLELLPALDDVVDDEALPLAR
jgi:hypothetical protein